MSGRARGRPRHVIGLTGNIACGKSAVDAMLGALGARVIDADRLARRVTEPGERAYHAVVARFGQDILADDGRIDRLRLGETVFADPEKLAALEAIIHPAVGLLVEEELRRSGGQVVVLDAIKLFEAGLARRCDSVWVVTCTREQQIERLAERGFGRQSALLRIEAQPPQEEKARLADVVIDNSGSLIDTERQVRAAWTRVVGASSSAAGS